MLPLRRLHRLRPPAIHTIFQRATLASSSSPQSLPPKYRIDIWAAIKLIRPLHFHRKNTFPWSYLQIAHISLLDSIFGAQSINAEMCESLLLPILLPTGHVKDLEVFKENMRFMQWLRLLWLSKHCDRYMLNKAKTALTSMSQRTALDPNLDEAYLPSRQKVIELFQLRRSSPDKWKPVTPAVATQWQEKLLQEPEKVPEWSLGDVLEAAGGCVYGRGTFNLYCEQQGVFEFFTSDYVSALAKYLAETHASDGSLCRVVDVGAGTGMLAYHLRKQLRYMGLSSQFQVTATDSGDWGRWGIRKTARYPVERLDYSSSLRKYEPDVVLCSWMPMGEDWTEAFRQHKSVREYILIGEADFGACGHNWLTFGNPAYRDHTHPSPSPPYAEDGFERRDLDQLSRLQMERFDSDLYAPHSSSRTVSFCRKQRPTNDNTA